METAHFCLCVSSGWMKRGNVVRWRRKCTAMIRFFCRLDGDNAYPCKAIFVNRISCVFYHKCKKQFTVEFEAVNEIIWNSNYTNLTSKRRSLSSLFTSDLGLIEPREFHQHLGGGPQYKRKLRKTRESETHSLGREFNPCWIDTCFRPKRKRKKAYKQVPTSDSKNF